MTLFGIHTARHHLDVVDTPYIDVNAFKWYLFYQWAVANHWNGGQPPTFAGRYFLGGMFQWAHGEGTAAQETIKTQWRPLGPLGDADVTPIERIAPIQSADPDRQSGLGPDGRAGVDYLAFWNGLADGTALCRRIEACLIAGELSISDSSTYLFLDVARGTALSTWYWAAWAHAVWSFTTFTVSGAARPIQPFLPAICCDFVEDDDSATPRYSLDPAVATCLNTAQLQHPHLVARCWGFWARATRPANLTHPLDFGRFSEYRQPLTSQVSRQVWLLIWRYAEQAAALDPTFVGANQISLDAVNDVLADLVVNRMLRIEQWSAADLRDDRRAPLYMGIDRATPFTQVEIDRLTGRDPATELPLPITVAETRPQTVGAALPFSGYLAFVMRYYAPAGMSKLLTVAELNRLVGAGLRVGIFWEVGRIVGGVVQPDWDDPRDSQGTPGYDHAREAFNLAAKLNQPPHTPVYFCPIDADAVNIPDARQRAEGYFSAVLAGYRKYLTDQRNAGLDPRPYAIGVYGGAQVFNYLYSQGIVSHFFQSCSERWWDNARVWAHINALQVSCLPAFVAPPRYFGSDADASWGDEGAGETWDVQP
jgi:hypothetical protein